MNHRILLGLASIVFAAPSIAAPQSKIAPGRTIVLKAARIFDGKGDRIATPGVVVITDGKIAAVGAGAAIPDGAEILDLGDATLLPGFIDAHTHQSGEATDDWNQAALDSLRKSVAEQALDASVNVRKTLMAGFTTVRDLGSEDQIDVALRNAIREGKIPGPRMLVSVHAIGATGGHCDNGGWRQGLFPETSPAEGVINGPDQARRAVRLAVKYGADVIKTCATGGVLSLTDDVDTPQLTQAELDALVDEAHALRRKAAAHAHGAEGAKRAIRAGIDSIEHGTFLDDEALDMMKARGVVLIPTLMASVGLQETLARKNNVPPVIAEKARNAIEHVHATVKKALAKGVKIGFGTDAAVYPHGRNAEEFNQLVSLGMRPADALRTIGADAELLGWPTRIGSLEGGKIADIVAVPGNPLEDIRLTEKVFFVMKEGAVFRNDRAK
ncbi:MAG: amidohydrolase family protein [Acidipila sp.]|nr:amidohydrolase family protein [Acidipila sp.]